MDGEELGSGEAITVTPTAQTRRTVKALATAAKPGKRGGPLDTLGFTLPNFVVPDAYTDIPGSLIDVLTKGVKTLGFQVAATLFGATYKAVGSMDGLTFVDLTTQDALGVNRPIDIPVAVGTTVMATISPATPAGAAASAFRFYKLQAKNTVAASVANVIATIAGKQ